MAEERLAARPRAARRDEGRASRRTQIAATTSRGAGPAVLFLHAFPLDLRHVGRAGPRRSRATHQVVRFDARGFGGTPPGDGLLTMERIADDAAALLDHLGVVAGHRLRPSMGGYAAFALVRRHPDAPEGAGAGRHAQPPPTPRRRSAPAPRRRTRCRREGPPAIADAFLQKLRRRDHAASERPEVVARVREMILGRVGRAASRTRWPAWPPAPTPAHAARDPGAHARGLREEDALTPVADSEAMSRGIPGSRLEIIPRAGHLSNLEDPAAFNRALQDFLSGLS